MAAIVACLSWQEVHWYAQRSANRRLTVAIANRDVPEVSQCLSDGADPNAGIQEQEPETSLKGILVSLLHLGVHKDAGKTMLIQAIETGHSEIVRLLFEAGADANLAGSDGTTPLLAALLHKDKVAARMLEQHGASLLTTRKDGVSVLMAACLAGDIEIVRASLRAGASAIAQDSTRQTPLHYAARSPNVEPLRLLLAEGVPIDSADSSGRTPLHLACTNANIQAALELIHHGADVLRRDSVRNMPVHVLVDSQNPQNSGGFLVLEALLKRGADLRSIGNYGAAPLIMASSGTGKSRLITWLIDHGSDVNQRTVPGGQTALHAMALYGDTEGTKTLLQRGARPNTRAKDGATPLWYACKMGNMRAARALIAGGADPTVHIGDSSTPLKAARENAQNCPEMVTLIDQAVRTWTKRSDR
jgi:ankyrin